MIWIKLKGRDVTKAVIYTTDKDLAAELGMFKKNKGKFWFKTIKSKPIRQTLGFIPKKERGGYMRMVHMYPAASAYIRRNEKIPLDIKAEMEKWMEWDSKTGYFNVEKRLD
jgi:hypothetical protein